MTNPENEPQFNRDEFAKIFDEYRARIEQITRQTELNLQAIRTAPDEETDTEEQPEATPEAETEFEATAGEQTPDAMPEETPEPAEEPEIAVPEPAAYQTPYDASVPAEEPQPTESAKIIHDAEKRAKRIIDEAEDRAKKEAKKKVKSQVDKLLEKARQEADQMIARAQEIVNQEKTEAIAASKAQTEQLLREITEEYRRETQACSAEALTSAREKADELMKEMVNASTEINKLVKQSLERAHNAVSEFETRLQEETASISQAIIDVQTRIEQLLLTAREPEYTLPAVPSEVADPATTAQPTLTMHILGDRSNGKNGTQPLFFGKVEMKSESATSEYQHFKNLKKLFVRIPNIKQLQESASEKEMSALFDITEPLPLLEILSKIPSVAEVVSNTDRDISIVFHNS